MTSDVDLAPDPRADEESEASTLTVTMAARFSGPLPHPDILKHYDEIEPGAAGRIIAMAESQQAHEHEMEQRAISIAPELLREKEKTYRWWIALPSTVVTIVLIAAFVAVSQMDTTWESYGLGGFIATLTLIVSVYRLFFHGRKSDDD